MTEVDSHLDELFESAMRGDPLSSEERETWSAHIASCETCRLESLVRSESQTATRRAIDSARLQNIVGRAMAQLDEANHLGPVMVPSRITTDVAPAVPANSMSRRTTRSRR